MAPVIINRRYFAMADILIFFLLATAIYGIIALSLQWRAEFHPVTEINLSFGALPRYALFSAIRGLVAYLLSLAFTLVVGFTAAKSKRAEKFIIPMIDILQSVPPLGFLPPLCMGLIALFPKTNTGLELVCVITIFTGQVWNMTFSFYSSLKSIPSDFSEASTVMGLTWFQKLLRLELPFSAVGLAWNSLLSMAGGWFFLIACEAFTLGEKNYRLPGLGAYMAVASEQGNSHAMIASVFAMIIVIVVLDFVIWHPILSWVRRFRLEDIPGVKPSEPFMILALRDSRLLRTFKIIFRRNFFRNHHVTAKPSPIHNLVNFKKLPLLGNDTEDEKKRSLFWHYAGNGFSGLVVVGIVSGSFLLLKVLVEVPGKTWLHLLMQTGLTFLRVLGALTISTLWAVPAGIWIGISPKRVRIAQPLIQILASFPAPMLYPLILTLMFSMGITLNWGSMFLLLMGVQWYVLFNVLAGSLRISQSLGDTLSLMKNSHWEKWKILYLPSVFPALVTGWVTAAGGAWNASIVAEYLSYNKKVIFTEGLGTAISTAAASGDSHTLAAALALMIVVVLTFNRVVWARVYRLAQTRFRMDM